MGIDRELSLNLSTEANLCFWTHKRWWGISEFPVGVRWMPLGGKGTGLGKGCRK